MGLGEDLRSRHGLDAMIHLDPHATAADLARHHGESCPKWLEMQVPMAPCRSLVFVWLFPAELADAIQENMHNFKPTDVIVFNIGNDYAEPRSLQASLLKFLRLYEDNAEHMPVLIWQESTAQHHQGLQVRRPRWLCCCVD